MASLSLVVVYAVVDREECISIGVGYPGNVSKRLLSNNLLFSIRVVSSKLASFSNCGNVRFRNLAICKHYVASTII